MLLVVVVGAACFDARLQPSLVAFDSQPLSPGPQHITLTLSHDLVLAVLRTERPTKQSVFHKPHTIRRHETNSSNTHHRISQASTAGLIRTDQTHVAQPPQHTTAQIPSFITHRHFQNPLLPQRNVTSFSTTAIVPIPIPTVPNAINKHPSFPIPGDWE